MLILESAWRDLLDKCPNRHGPYVPLWSLLKPYQHGLSPAASDLFFVQLLPIWVGATFKLSLAWNDSVIDLGNSGRASHNSFAVLSSEPRRQGLHVSGGSDFIAPGWRFPRLGFCLLCLSNTVHFKASYQTLRQSTYCSYIRPSHLFQPASLLLHLFRNISFCNNWNFQTELPTFPKR